jgi:hypothetical protein
MRQGRQNERHFCTHFIAAYLSLSLTIAILMAEGDASVSDHDSESGVNESPGIKTLQARPIALASFREPPRNRILDTLTTPATSAECERTFGSAKKLAAPERNRLGDDIIETTESLKAW